MSDPLTIPRIVVAAPASGHGKTTIATGLMAAFAARGLTVSPHKVGPDYIDPGYHQLAAGRVGRNLDPFLVGVERIAPLFRHGVQTPTVADIAVVEGVMGLYDGAVGRAEFASTAQVAKLLGAPVLFVVDAAAQGRSIAALVNGFVGFDPAVRIGGVVLNRVGSQRHESILREALQSIGMPVLGALHRDPKVANPSRHLGLIPVAERAAEALAGVDAMRELITAALDIEAVLDLAASAEPLDTGAWSATAEIAELGGEATDSPRIAVFGGAAFTFGYPETAELLTAAGAEVLVVDPLRDAALPPGTQGLVIGGGFPEVYAEKLAANTSLLREVAEFAGPIAAECAGLLYLAQSLDDQPMAGLIPGRASMSERLSLGYREATASVDSLLTRRGEVVRGHEFHRTTCAYPPGDASSAWSWSVGAEEVHEGYATAEIHASYLHLHWAGSPQFAHRFVAACLQVAA